MKVTTAPDFENLLPPLGDAELSQLELNCLADRDHERMPPVLVWANHKNTIIDGHNQHRIREKHRLKIKYARLSFDTRDEAIRHALDVQFGRRNLDASQRAMAYAKVPRQPAGGDRRSDQTANLQFDPATVSELAEAAGVSERTMSSAVKVADNCAAAIVKSVQDGLVTASDAASIAELAKKEQLAALKKVKSGEAKTLREAAAQEESPIEEVEPEDAVGTKLPPKLQDIFDIAEQFDRQATALAAVKKWANEIGESVAGSYLHVQSFVGQLNAAQKQLKFEKPYAVCPYCLAKNTKCDACKGRGFVTKPIYDGAPSELRA